MDDRKKLEDEIQDQPKVGSGSLLAAARKSQKRTVEEIADELNLSVTQIRTIELDQSEGLPEPTYVRGYIRSYARLLDLNVDEVLGHYLNPNWQKGTRLDDMPRGIGNANDSSDARGFFTPLKTVFILAVLSLAGFFWFSGKFEQFINTTPSTTNSNVGVDAPQQVSQEVVNEVVQEPQSDNTDAGNISENESLLSTELDSNDAGSELDGSEGAAEDENVENNLVLSFSDSSWVEINDEEGNRLAFKVYDQGEVLNLSSASTMTVFLGNAKSVSAIVNGEPYDISQHQEGAFARFKIGE